MCAACGRLQIDKPTLLIKVLWDANGSQMDFLVGTTVLCRALPSGQLKDEECELAERSRRLPRLMREW
jgi:hypothetical protein